MENFLGLRREIRKHWIYKDSEYYHAWSEMLFCARYSQEPETELIDGELIEVNYGEFLYGRKSWSERLGISEQRLRTLVSKLVKEEMIELVSQHRKCSKYRVVNYAKFNHQSNHQNNQSQQGFEAHANHQNNQLSTTSQPPANHQPTTKEERKKDNNEKNEVNKKNTRRKRTYDEDSSPYKLAVYLYSKICEWTDQVNPPNLQTWADECRLLLEVDKRDKHTVRDVIDWVTKDEFWQGNILSPQKLRKHFVRLCVDRTKYLSKTGEDYSGNTKIVQLKGGKANAESVRQGSSTFYDQPVTGAVGALPSRYSADAARMS